WRAGPGFAHGPADERWIAGRLRAGGSGAGTRAVSSRRFPGGSGCRRDSRRCAECEGGVEIEGGGMNIVEQEVWAELRRAAIEESEGEPVLSGHLYDLVIRHRGYPEALAYLIAARLGTHLFNVVAMSDLISDTIRRYPEIVTASLYDLDAVL